MAIPKLDLAAFGERLAPFEMSRFVAEQKRRRESGEPKTLGELVLPLPEMPSAHPALINDAPFPLTKALVDADPSDPGLIDKARQHSLLVTYLGYGKHLRDVRINLAQWDQQVIFNHQAEMVRRLIEWAKQRAERMTLASRLLETRARLRVNEGRTIIQEILAELHGQHEERIHAPRSRTAQAIADALEANRHSRERADHLHHGHPSRGIDRILAAYQQAAATLQPTTAELTAAATKSSKKA